MALNMTGSYVSRVAIHDTFQRAITIHWSHALLINEVVAYNITGHAYFLEDAIENGNVLLRNLGAVIQPHNLIESDAKASVFWLTNPANHLRHNVAVGGNFGYWYAIAQHPIGKAVDYETNLIWPRAVPAGDFKYNRAHSPLSTGLFYDEGVVDTFGFTEMSSFRPRNIPPVLGLTQEEKNKFNGMSLDAVSAWIDQQRPIDTIAIYFTAFKCPQHGMWGRGSNFRFVSAMLADNLIGAQFPGGPNVLEDCVIVGETDNIGMPDMYTKSWRPLEGRTRPNWDVAATIYGYRNYDTAGPYIITRNRFYNYQPYVFKNKACVVGVGCPL